MLHCFVNDQNFKKGAPIKFRCVQSDENGMIVVDCEIKMFESSVCRDGEPLMISQSINVYVYSIN